MNCRGADAVWWQRLPDCLAEGEPAVLVTVVRVTGSTPREPGATLLVERERVTDTLGGGNLEFEAIASARDLLAGGGQQPLVRYALGPGLRQCCGGAVWLLYERLEADPQQAAAWQARAQALQRGERLLRNWRAGAPVSRWRLLQQGEQRDSLLADGHNPGWQQVVGATAFPLRLFGAGHVGRALARTLVQTEARLQWVDSRPAMQALAPELPLRVCDDPVAAVDDAPPACWFIVMTHSHTLDFELVEAILRRRDAAFCGLIGSSTKAARFRHNLVKQGLSPELVAQLTCPIGIPGIRDKSPAAVAIAVAAQVLLLREASRQMPVPAPRPSFPTVLVPARTS